MQPESQLFMQHMSEKTNHHRQRGFTLVEMLVVAPLIVLTIAVIVGFLVSLVGDSIAANTRTQSIYDVQTALTQIERDSFLGTQFMSSFTPRSPQGKDDGTGAFSTSIDPVTNAPDIIINQFGTSSDPTDPTRSVVYYANQPQACTGQYQANQPFFVKVIYFLKVETDGSKSLYRRTIVPLNNTGSNNGDTTCTAPWQRGSCKIQNLSDVRCPSKDIRLLTNVTSLTATYYNKSDPTLTISDPTIADSLRVTATVSQSVAGKTVAQTASIASTRTNNADPTPKPPGAPVISILNPTNNDYNNPVLSTFQWSASGVTQYSYTYKIDAGSWSAPVVTSGTNVGVTTPYSNVTITFSVTASNDNGSTTSQYVYKTPVWTVPALQNNWTNYATIYPTSGYATAGYTKTSAGIIVFKGLVQRTGTPVSAEGIFTLPLGCRPADDNMFLAGGVGAADRLDVNPTGLVRYQTGGAAFLSLEGIAYVPAGSSYVWTNVTPQSGWANYVDSSGWATAGYTIDSQGRVFTKGLVGGGPTADGTVIISVPAGYRSAEYLHLATTSNNMIDVTGVTTAGGIITKSINQNVYRSIQHNYYASGRASWIGLSLQNGWAQFPVGTAPFSTVQYTKGSDGIVKVKGLMNNGTVASGTVVATLPPGYRPAEISLQSSTCYLLYCRFDILPNGNIITRDNVNAGWSSLDTITFLAEQ